MSWRGSKSQVIAEANSTLLELLGGGPDQRASSLGGRSVESGNSVTDGMGC